MNCLLPKADQAETGRQVDPDRSSCNYFRGICEEPSPSFGSTPAFVAGVLAFRPNMTSDEPLAGADVPTGDGSGGCRSEKLDCRSRGMRSSAFSTLAPSL
jgi:hypothetical protein